MAILAGGSNARMESLRGTIYKGFLPIHGMSLVARHVVRAASFGVRRVAVMVGAYDPALALLAQPAESGSEEAAEPDVEPDVEIVVQPGSPAEKIVWWSDARQQPGPALIVLGDSLAPVDLTALWRKAVEPGVDSAIAFTRLRLPFGSFDMSGDLVRSFAEKPVLSSLVNTGYMAMGPAAIRYMREGVSLFGTLERLAADGVLRGIGCAGPLTTVDSFDGLADAHRHLRR
jgi:NDP-sugar pyrophosphorylase family protein